MNIKNIFEDNRSQSIESLQFFFFLKEIYFSLLEENDSKNNQIQEFIDIIGKNYYWQSYKIQNYITSLRDYVFWESSASDFASTVYFLIRNDRKEFECLIEDFEKQATLELNPKIFQFSKIISDFELVLEGFIPEPTNNLTEDK
jgi:hypothetical protein